MYNIIYNILSIPAQNANSNVVQASIAILVISFVVSLYSIFKFLCRVFSVR